MPDILVRKLNGGLFPTDDVSKEAMDKLPVGKLIGIDVKQSRNLQRLRLYWAMCQKIADHNERLPVKEAVANAFLTGTGRCQYYTKGNGEVLPVYQSIKFHKMTELEFSQFIDQCMVIVWRDILPNWDDAQRAELLSIIGK